MQGAIVSSGKPPREHIPYSKGGLKGLVKTARHGSGLLPIKARDKCELPPHQISKRSHHSRELSGAISLVGQGEKVVSCCSPETQPASLPSTAGMQQPTGKGRGSSGPLSHTLQETPFQTGSFPGKPCRRIHWQPFSYPTSQPKLQMYLKSRQCELVVQEKALETLQKAADPNQLGRELW